MKYIFSLVFLFPLPAISQPFPGKIGAGLDGIGGKALEFDFWYDLKTEPGSF